jgi:cytidyltransferase-like protein
MNDNELLRAIYSTNLRSGSSTIEDLEAELGEPASDIGEAVGRAIGAGLVVKTGGKDGFSLTEMGRANLKVVMIGGAFEIIHPGHIHTMAEARKLGDTLVAVVATDSAVLKNKGREPVTTQELRVRLVSSLRMVDVALAGGKGSIYETLERVRPDVVALGYDQKHNPIEIEDEARRRGMSLRVVRLDSPIPGIKTSKIIQSL